MPNFVNSEKEKIFKVLVFYFLMTKNSLLTLGWFITIVRNTFVLEYCLPLKEGSFPRNKYQVTEYRSSTLHYRKKFHVFSVSKIRKKGGLILLPASINTKQGTSKTRK